MTDKILPFSSNVKPLHNIPAMLRYLADSIENGIETAESALVLIPEVEKSTMVPKIFAYGAIGDAYWATGVLFAASTAMSAGKL